MTSRIPHLQFRSLSYTGRAAGARLIITGAVHGNETCGASAIESIISEFNTGKLRLLAGTVTLVPVANPLAYARGERMGERDLNRHLIPTARPADFEDEVANWLCPLLAQHDVLLDLHSFNADGEPFVLVGPVNNHGTLEPFAQSGPERALARRLGVRRFVSGWLASYGRGVHKRVGATDLARLKTELAYGVGTTEYMRRVNGYALTLECGNHNDPQAIQVARRAILNTLAHLGMIHAPSPKPVPPEQMETLAMIEVVDKIHANDTFNRPWMSFDRFGRGEHIGVRANGEPVLAPCDCVIMFPDQHCAVGCEWFYLAHIDPHFEMP